MRKFLTTFIFIASQSFVYTESLGNLAQYPPLGVDLTISTTQEGFPSLTPSEISLNTGQYILNINCDLNINCPYLEMLKILT